MYTRSYEAQATADYSGVTTATEQVDPTARWREDRAG